MSLKHPATWILALSVATLAGCSGGTPSLAKVHGKVTYKGEALKAGNVLFIPATKSADGLDHPAASSIKPDGTYELTTFVPGDGAAVGSHKVAVIALDGGPVEEPKLYDGKATVAPKGGGKKITMKSLVPEKYSSPETTPLTLEVKSGDNVLDIVIPD